MSELYDKIETNYWDTIENVAQMVTDDYDGWNRDEAIQEEIVRQFHTNREDTDLLIAYMAKVGYVQYGQEVDWVEIGCKVYEDVVNKVEEMEAR